MAMESVNKRLDPQHVRAIDTMLGGYFQIKFSLNAIALARRYINANPPRARAVSNDEYLRYHTYAYIQEIYILRERVTRYLVKIGRAYKNAGSDTDLPALTAALAVSVGQALSPMTKVRGAHVHEERYDDGLLRRLTGLSLLSRDTRGLAKMRRDAYQKSRRYWIARLRREDLTLRKTIEEAFKDLRAALASSGVLHPPPTTVDLAGR
jgi:hypothetical protein